MRKIRISHVTTYSYSEAVEFGAHQLFIRPREGHDIRISSSKLRISPAAKVKWYRDLNGNSVADVQFSESAGELKINSEVVIEHYDESPYDFEIEDSAVNYPFNFRPFERLDLAPDLSPCYPNDQNLVENWVKQFWQSGRFVPTYELLQSMNLAIANQFEYQMREEPGVQRPEEILQSQRGSCRDYATLMIEACRYLGIPARFVSGYLNCPETVVGHGSTHAWTEIYLPGAGWKGFDSTSGSVTGPNHIAVAVARHPEAIPPVSGSFKSAGAVSSQMRVQVDVNTL
ncbi:MAG: transglutaminase family protein [Verrucomicrobiota bacterium]